MMKSTAVLFLNSPSVGAFDRCFDGKSPAERSCEFMEKVTGSKPYVITVKEYEKYFENICEKIAVSENKWTNGLVLGKLVEICEETGSETVVFGFADCPFYCESVTAEILETQEKYAAEYTYADGYPFGFTPEALNAGTVKILCGLLEGSASSFKDQPFSKDSLFEILKTDINSFEVECVIAGNDYRLLRYDFSGRSKRTHMASKSLWNLGIENVLGKDVSSDDFEKVLDKAAVNPSILKTLPAYYNLQIATKVNDEPVYSPYKLLTEKKWGKSPLDCNAIMGKESFSKLINEIEDFSGTAVINLSMWGEPLYHPDFLEFTKIVLAKPGLSLFIETDGLLWTDEIIAALAEIVESAPERTNGYDKLMVSVFLDAFTPEMYKKIRGNDGFPKAVDTLVKLCRTFKGSVFPQYVRMHDNESELESFYRYWSNAENESGGKLIIQKYDGFAGLLPAKKPADLSPLERNVCWHLRRDVNILCDGSVPLCRTFLSESIGNVFEEGIESVWKKYDKELAAHIKGDYCKTCGKCDEYYTYNF